MKHNFVFLGVIVTASFVSASVSAQTFTQRVGQGFQSPVFATSPPGDPNRLFVVEQGRNAAAQVRILDLTTNTTLATPFLSMSNLTTGGERGFLGMAFHPDYAENGKFYVYVSIPGGSQDHVSQVREYTVSGDPTTSNVADGNSMKSVLIFEQPFGNHNAGWIGFNPTAAAAERSHLYIATGDGGSGGDPHNNSQDITNNLLGKILRVDVNRDDFASSSRNYGIPTNNPFVVSGDDEIWAYGLRNPYRNSFDRATGDLWIGDVGQGAREEINVLSHTSAGGENYGWRVMEGDDCFDNGQVAGNPPCGDSSLTAPVYDYGHGEGHMQGNSVTGGYVYRGPVAEFQGHFFFADFVSNNIWTLDPYSSGPAVVNRNSDLVPDVGAAPTGIVSFAEDDAGELYIVAYGGTLYRLASTSRESRWLGSAADSGSPGDGASWNDTNNWVRDDVADEGFVAGDHVVLGDGPENALQMTSSQRVAALTFSSDFELAILPGAEVEVTSGNIFVGETVGAKIFGDLRAETAERSIRKLGPGELVLSTTIPRELAVLEGTATVATQSEFVSIAEAGFLEQPGLTASDNQPEIGTLVAEPGSLIRLLPATPTAGARAMLSITDATLAGNLEIVRPAGYQDPTQPGTVDVFPLLDIEAVDGVFAEVTFGEADLGHQGNGLFYLLERSDSFGTSGQALGLLNYRAIPGDVDGNRVVNFDDFLKFSNHFAQAGGWAEGDFDGNRLVEFSDFLQLSSGFGEVAELSSVSPVPEPAAFFTLLWAAAAACWHAHARIRGGAAGRGKIQAGEL